MSALNGRDILFEMIRLGNVVKVTAIDPVTQIEVSVAMPATMGAYSLKQAARKRLEYVITKKMGQAKEG